MKKISYFILLFGFALLISYMAGIVEINDNPFLTLLLEPQNMDNSAFWFISVAGALGSVAAIIIGIFSRDLNFALKTTLFYPLLTLLWGIVDLFIIVYSLNQIIALLVFSPIMLLTLISIVEWMGGTD